MKENENNSDAEQATLPKLPSPFNIMSSINSDIARALKIASREGKFPGLLRNPTPHPLRFPVVRK